MEFENDVQHLVVELYILSNKGWVLKFAYTLSSFNCHFHKETGTGHAWVNYSNEIHIEKVFFVNYFYFILV